MFSHILSHLTPPPPKEGILMSLLCEDLRFSLHIILTLQHALRDTTGYKPASFSLHILRTYYKGGHLQDMYLDLMFQKRWIVYYSLRVYEICFKINNMNLSQNGWDQENKMQQNRATLTSYTMIKSFSREGGLSCNLVF